MVRQVRIGSIPMGGGAPITIQSMTNTKTGDIEATSGQIRALYNAGCDIVRVTVNDEAAANAVRALVDQAPCPLVADIHFDYRLAIRAIESGIHKLRINPGNIGDEAKVRMVADCLKAHHIPARIGVNAGSLEKDILEKYAGPSAEALVESALGHARLFEKYGFDELVLSMKSSDVQTTYRAYCLARDTSAYPLHVGVTEAGAPGMGTVKSAVGIGGLLLRGIGDTIRVSLTGDPVLEVEEGLNILRACGLRRDFVDVVSCPTCGRTEIDVAGIAQRVREATKDMTTPLRVAVMGCVVNGPGEARACDLGIAGGKSGGVLIVKGEAPRAVKGDLFEALMREIRRVAS